MWFYRECTDNVSVIRKMFISTMLILSVSIVIALLCACESQQSNSNDLIIGKWQAYGVKDDEGIYSYESAYDKSTTKQLTNRFVEFNNGKVTMYDGNEILVEGKYEDGDSKSQYVLKFNIGKNETSTMNAQVEDGYLIITEVVPAEYKDEVDEGDANVFVKVDK